MQPTNRYFRITAEVPPEDSGLPEPSVVTTLVPLGDASPVVIESIYNRFVKLYPARTVLWFEVVLYEHPVVYDDLSRHMDTYIQPKPSENQ